MEIEFDFYDLAVIPGLFANGTAEITVHPDGMNDEPEWFIGKIYLHGENNKCEEVMRDLESPCGYRSLDDMLYLRIHDALEHQYADKINDQIASELLECVA